MSSILAQTSQLPTEVETQPLVVPFSAVDRHSLALVGGKAANLGELVRAGLPVPLGFCVTTHAYDLFVAQAALGPMLDELDHAPKLSIERLTALAAEARAVLLSTPIPAAITMTAETAYAALGNGAVAVRSSATAEDLPEASFAGQQDTYLNIVGVPALSDAIRRCWASLWTDRAVAYRTTNRIDQRAVKLSVVVQQMVPAVVAGVLFTANPLTNRHTESVIDATFGLGEALVSGAVNPDHFVVDTSQMVITSRQLARKTMAIEPAINGGTHEVMLDAEQQSKASLSDHDVLRVARLGQAVSAHYGTPQDIEWAIDSAGELRLLQARPITTLFPALDVAATGPDRVFFSFNVAQGVLQPLTPLGLDVFCQIGGAMAELLGFAADPDHGPAVMAAGAGRLYIDATAVVRRPWGRRVILTLLSKAEPRTADALRPVLDDPRFAPTLTTSPRSVIRRLGRVARRAKVLHTLLGALRDPDTARQAAQRDIEALLAEAARPAATAEEALERVRWLLAQLPQKLLLRIAPVAMFGGVGAFFVAQQLVRPLPSAADALLISRGLPFNVTTEMNLALWQVVQAIKNDPASRAVLAHTTAAELAAQHTAGSLPAAFKAVVDPFFARYGFRGVAEIDTGVARWSEAPGYLLSIMQNYAQLDDPALAPDVQFRRAAAEAETAMIRLTLEAGRTGVLGGVYALLLRWLFRRVRGLMGLRETPKFYMVAAFARSRQLMQQVGSELVAAGRLAACDDIFFLTFAEARKALGGHDYRALVATRQAEYARESKRQRQPRVMLNDGTAFFGETAPAADGTPTLSGNAASPGVYTGRARVITDPHGARLEPGDILVAPSTDPGWTPLFMTAGALVMEMGGMMSHGAVVAREYGIPAVVGALDATTTIRDGQQITVDGTHGVVLLGAPEA